MAFPDLNNELGAIITIISALSAAVVSVINAFRSRAAHKRQIESIDQVGTRVELVQKQTNGDRDRLLMEVAKKDLTIQELRISLMRKDIELQQYVKKVITPEDNAPKE